MSSGRCVQSAAQPDSEILVFVLSYANSCGCIQLWMHTLVDAYSCGCIQPDCRLPQCCVRRFIFDDLCVRQGRGLVAVLRITASAMMSQAATPFLVLMSV